MRRLPGRLIVVFVGLALGITAWTWPSGHEPDDARGKVTSPAADKALESARSDLETTVQPVWNRPAHGGGAPSVAAAQAVRTTRQPAHIEAYEETTIYAKAAGFVSKVQVDLGSRVKRGDVLAELWIPEMEQDHARKQALVEEAAAAVGQADAAIIAAEAALSAAAAEVEESRAQIERYQAELKFRNSEHARFTELVASRAVEQALLDEKLKQLDRKSVV